MQLNVNALSSCSEIDIGLVHTKIRGRDFDIGSSGRSFSSNTTAQHGDFLNYDAMSKLASARHRSGLMPDRGGEYREAFHHGGWHSSSWIACHSSQRDLSILTR